MAALRPGRFLDVGRQQAQAHADEDQPAGDIDHRCVHRAEPGWRDLVPPVRTVTATNSLMGLGDKDLRGIVTWCRTWSRLGPGSPQATTPSRSMKQVAWRLSADPQSPIASGFASAPWTATASTAHPEKTYGTVAFACGSGIGRPSSRIPFEVQLDSIPNVPGDFVPSPPVATHPGRRGTYAA